MWTVSDCPLRTFVRQRAVQREYERGAPRAFSFGTAVRN
jgi:hypothetical protein